MHSAIVLEDTKRIALRFHAATSLMALDSVTVLVLETECLSTLEENSKEHSSTRYYN